MSRATTRNRRPLGALLSLVLLLTGTPLSSAGPKGTGQKKKPDAEKPWKVDAVHGPFKTVAFGTEEGTWLSLDVHPDGKRLVFSLLGDLYLLPIGGGRARRITTGAAYDLQPRFSPDGKWIAFASDRSGMENLWICDLNGKNARQVSQEKDHTVDSPAWSPDGRWLVGRKRLTDTSSIGTVELWMWHLRGGGGIQLTKKGKQPDAADPAFSVDGRFLYFSARGARYRYNRNVYQGIWQVKQLDRHTGQFLPVLDETGGTAVPAPSPDGKLLAYVRRSNAKTQIEVLSLATGKTRVVARDVQRDLMEGFASHGVFPGYAWTPDGRSLVATAGGRFWRWDVATGARTAIPFTARVEQRVTDALRFPQKAGGDQVRARIIRWPVQSPDGKHLVFSAVGHLYVMALPSGTPRRLTQGQDLEYAPAFSPDGTKLAFVTWNDRDGGHLWTAPFSATGVGTPQRLSAVPGQYANPSFSADGTRIVFIKGSGATFRDHDLADELWFQIRWIPSAGGPNHYVIGTKNRGPNRRMPRPQFSPEADRIFYVEDEKAKKPHHDPKTVLVSVKLDGTDKRKHLRFNLAEEASVSPNGRWVAFNELHNAYVTALPPLRQTVTVKLEKAAIPVAQLTDEGGEWVGWADGGRTITWAFGPTYYRLPLGKAFPIESSKVPAGKKTAKDKKEKKAKKKLPKATATTIVLTIARARPRGVVAYRGARVVTMKGDLVHEKGTIVVRDDRIAAVGPADQVKVPAGAKVVDLSGRTVIPGLFDEHAHLHYSTLDIFPQRPWKYLANLAYGVTSTHDPSASTHEVFAQSEMVEAGLMTGPRIYSTGFILYGAENPGKAVVKSLEDARHHLRRLKRLGAFTVKSYMQPRREQRQWIIEAAREEKMMVVPEGGGDLEMDMTMVLDGHTTIEHSLPVTPLRKDVITLLGQSGTAYAPTLLVSYGGLFGEKWFYQHREVWKDKRLSRYVPSQILDVVGRIRTMAPDNEWHHLGVAASAKKVVEAGGRVCLGGHGQMQGAGPHWEMWAFVQAGMTPLQALRVATLSPAEALGLDRDLGSIETGKLADFVVLDKNPLEKIENSESVELVIKNGVAYDPKQLARRTPGQAAPGSFR